MSLIKTPRPVPPALPVLDADAAAALTSSQLRGLQCWRSPDCDGPLAPAGHAYTEPQEPGAPLGWVVVACARHREAA